MFKFNSEEQVAGFVDQLEKFIHAVVDYRTKKYPNTVEDTMFLNRQREKFEEFLSAMSGITPATNTTDTLLCPDCGSEMKLRTNSQNGQKFWGCTKYPKCRGTRDEDGLSREEREAQKIKREEVSQEGGFSFNKEKRNPVTEVKPPTDWYPFDK